MENNPAPRLGVAPANHLTRFLPHPTDSGKERKPLPSVIDLT